MQTLWRPGPSQPAFAPAQILEAVHRIREPAYVIQGESHGSMGVGIGGDLGNAAEEVGFPPVQTRAAFPLVASLPPLFPEWLGDRSFAQVHGVRFPYVTGAMANGIATTRIVIEMARAGFLGFFGAAGLPRHQVEEAIETLQRELDPTGLPWGSNLINSPNEPSLEEGVADLYIRRGVRRISASAYMALTPSIVRYAATGLFEDASGTIQRRHHVFAKISRPEVARHFLEPAPAALLHDLVNRGLLSENEARLAARVPVAEDLIVESDSGGHTDNRPLMALFPSIVDLRDAIMASRGYDRPIRLGAAGGLGTPTAVAAAFGLGAAFVLTGSVNQACVESGIDQSGRNLLAEAGIADVIMAPAADMFEQGVKVQVLRRGSMFAVRAFKLYELYRAYPSLESIPPEERQRTETQILRATFEQSWQSTRRFWSERDPREVTRAERDPKHKMALVFRAYLGLASRWAITGQVDRSLDYQLWCGPSMGAFNSWVKGSFLEDPGERRVVQVARNLMEGAAVVTRAHQLRCVGLPVPPAAFNFRPRSLD